MKNSKTALNMLGVSSPINNGKDTLTQGRSKWSHFISNVKAKLQDKTFQKDVKTFLNLASIPLGFSAIRFGRGAHAIGKSLVKKAKPQNNIITKGELHGRVRAFNKPGMKKSAHGYGANPHPNRWGQ